MKTEIFRAECLNVKLELAKLSQKSSKVAFEFLYSYDFLTYNLLQTCLQDFFFEIADELQLKFFEKTTKFEKISQLI